MQPAASRPAAAGLRVAAAVAFLGLACSSGPSPRGPLPALFPGSLAAVIDSVVTAPPLDRTQWGIAVIERGSGATLIARNADTHFIPASNQKLVVAAVALAELGPDWRYETSVLVAAEPHDSVASALVIRSRGDPTWSERFFPTDLAVLDSIAAAILNAGITRITGDVVIDATYFDDAPVHGTWEVGDLPFGFAPPIEPFAIAEATFRLSLEPGVQVGEAARAVPVGEADWQPVAARLRTGAPAARAARQLEGTARSDSVRVTGVVPLGTADTLRLAVTSPADYAARALRSRLEAGGVRVSGGVRVVRDSIEASRLEPGTTLSSAAASPQAGPGAALREVARIRSAPMADIVAAILRPSQNWIAEMVLKTLGAERRGEGTWEAGTDVARRYLIDRAGIDSLSFVLRDASGLSVQNLLTPGSILRLLEHARTQAWGTVFRDALPSPGMPESTLEGRLTELQDRLWAKTGTITHVNSLSGFLVREDGRELTFSIMTNASGRSSAAVRRGMDRIIRALAQERGSS